MLPKRSSSCAKLLCVKKYLRCFALGVGIAGICVWLAYWVAPYGVALPATLEADSHYPSCRVWDADGNVLTTLRGHDYEWRFPVALDAVSPDLIQAIIATEDQRFYSHHGVDYCALLRAGRDLIFSGRIVSGASTITMQCVRLMFPEKRSFTYKLKQLIWARALEMRYSKNEILTYYLNHLLFGGKIVGVEAAAQYYFGKSARELNFAESTLLAGIPQRPNFWRPDRFPERIHKRQKFVLEMMYANGAIDAATVQKNLANSHLLTDALDTAFFRAKLQSVFPFSSQHYVNRVAIFSVDSPTIQTVLNPKIQNALASALQTRLSLLRGVNDAAGVVIENATGNVSAMVGSVDFDAEPMGQVNAATSPRSSGSVLKPFVYLLGLDEGQIVPQTILKDEALVLKDYRPENYDLTYRGNVTATDAIAHSLNTPVVRLAHELGLRRVLNTLARVGIREFSDSDAQRIGLSVVLGGAEVSLLNLTNAYAGLARGGKFFPYTFLFRPRIPLADTPFHPGAVALLTAMLRSEKMPCANPFPCAWKTGTSSGNRDAWCVAYTPDYTVGVWFGNKSGRGDPRLVGGLVAVPALNSVMQFLHPYSQWNTVDTGIFENITICAESGLGATGFCTRKQVVSGIPGLPLKSCPICAQKRTSLGKIRTPESAVYFTTDPELTLSFSTTQGTFDYYLNGRYWRSASSSFVEKLPCGTYRLQLRSRVDNTCDEVIFEVRRR